MKKTLLDRIKKLLSDRTKLHEELTQVKTVLRVPYLAQKCAHAGFDNIEYMVKPDIKRKLSFSYEESYDIYPEYSDKGCQTERNQPSNPTRISLTPTCVRSPKRVPSPEPQKLHHRKPIEAINFQVKFKSLTKTPRVNSLS